MTTLNLKALVAKLQPESHASLEKAVSICVKWRHFDVEIEHLIAALINDEVTYFHALLKQNNISFTQLETDLNNNFEQLKVGNTQAPAISTRIIDLLNEAWLIASLENGELLINSGFLLQALLQNNTLKQIAYGISNEFKKLSLDTVKNQQVTPTKHDTIQSTAINSTQKALLQYTVNLNEQAKTGKIDQVIGREYEIRQMIDILSRRRQNNAILTGEPGVGKTAIVEGLALNISKQQVPDNLKDTVIHALDLGLLQAGAGVKGEFENRLKSLINEIKQSPVPIILFIDEAHMLIGTGSNSDAANLLKPALARGELRSIAATTWAEYKQHFEKDAALTRRFQVVKVEEPDLATTVHMLRSLLPALEQHHHIHVLDSALHAAANLSLRYITGRYLPDKAVSVLDTACARVAGKQATLPAIMERKQQLLTYLQSEKAMLTLENAQTIDHQERLIALEQEYNTLKKEFDILTDRWHEEKSLVGLINELSKQIIISSDTEENKKVSQEVRTKLIKTKKKLQKMQQDQALITPWVDYNTIAEVIADWTGVPVGNMLKDEIKQLLNLKKWLQQKIVGQDHALAKISQAVQASGAKLTDPDKPLAIFLFIGPSGVGKTETALCLAEALYGSQKKATVINMSEFKEEHKVSMLVGAPPGYVGYGEGGVLTEAVRRQPYSLLLLDEIEKAHPGVQDVFYQVFDKGTIKDGQGRDIDFKNTIIILTSNACSEQICNYYDNSKKFDLEELLVIIQTNLLKFFKPAFLGRLRVIPFVPLTNNILEHIIVLKLNKIVDRMLTEQKITFSYDIQLIKDILAKCQQHNIGARQIDNIISTSLMPKLSNFVLENLLEKKLIKSLVIDSLKK